MYFHRIGVTTHAVDFYISKLSSTLCSTNSRIASTHPSVSFNTSFSQKWITYQSCARKALSSRISRAYSPRFWLSSTPGYVSASACVLPSSAHAKFTIHEDSDIISQDGNVGRAGEPLIVQPISKPQMPQTLCQKDFRLALLQVDTRHPFGCFRGRVIWFWMFHLVLSPYLRCHILINDPIVDAAVPQKLQPIPLFIADRVTSKRIVPSYNFSIVLVQIILIICCDDTGFYHS